MLHKHQTHGVANSEAAKECGVIANSIREVESFFLGGEIRRIDIIETYEDGSRYGLKHRNESEGEKVGIHESLIREDSVLNKHASVFADAKD